MEDYNMKHVVEYKLHGGVVPYFIQDGGYFPHNGRLIGLTKDDIDCYVPPVSELYTIIGKEEFVNYITALTLFSTPSFSAHELSTEEKQQLANDWWDARHSS
jgi:hypothetical protein